MLLNPANDEYVEEMMGREHPTFQILVCRSRGIPSTSFEQTVLFECLPARRRGLAKLLWRFHRSYFDSDLVLIGNVASATSLNDVIVELNDRQYRRQNVGLLRKLLRVRLSGQQLVNLANAVLPSE